MKRATGGVTLLVGLSMAALNPAPSFAQDNDDLSRRHHAR